jgi:hypothetical protein
MRLASFSPSSDYPSLHLDWYVYLVRVVHDGVHPFDHRFLQLSLCVRRLFYLARDDHLVVAHKDRHGSRTPIPTLPQ